MDLENYHVKTDVYEGPLEVLLNLIEKRKLLVNDISLAKVADDYVQHVRSLESLPISDTAAFVLIASTLLLIKSKSLLPNLELSSEEEEQISDLEDRLKLRARFKELAEHVREHFGKDMLFAAEESKREVVVFAPDTRTTPSFLLAIAKRVLAALPKPEQLAKATVAKVISLEEMILSLSERIAKSMKTSFADMTKGAADKVEIIVSFLAMLELVKQGIVNVRQDKQFETIEMESANLSVPRY